MKKFSVMMMALALVMGMTQCKKEQSENNNTTDELVGEKYEISLNLGGGDGNTKAQVHPFEGADLNYAPVYFDDGTTGNPADVIQVVYKGVRVGQMTCTASHVPTDPSQYNEAYASFVGSITVADDAIDGQSPLYFYFIGNKTYGNESGKFIVDISDQTSGLPVISYAASKEAFPSSTNTYTIDNGYNGSNWLLNQCALVKFTCENIYNQSANANDNNPEAIYTTDKVITLHGMDNQVTIDLSNQSFSWAQTPGGQIKLYLPNAPQGETAEQTAERIKTRYAIVHQGSYDKTNAELEVAYTPSSYTDMQDLYGFYGTYNLSEDIKMNDYYPGGEIDLVWHSGAFSIDAQHHQVVFSRGNLQYAEKAVGSGENARPGQTWRFAKHQYDWVGGWLERGGEGVYQGNVVLNETASTSTTRSDNTQVKIDEYEGWLDLFGYGTTAHDPRKYSSANGDYIINEGSTFNPSYHFEDWGENKIVNSGTPGNTSWWVTLTKDECKYIFEDRANADDKLGFAEITFDEGDAFGNAKVRGLVVLPDYWNDSWNIGTWYKAQWDASETWLVWPSNHTNRYTKDQWRTMELHGAVFLPCAGYRDTDYSAGAYRIEYDGGEQQEQNRGTYWSHGVQSSSAAYGLGFGYASGADLGNHVQGNTGLAPDDGRSVRLVHKLSSSGSKFFGKKK